MSGDTLSAPNAASAVPKMITADKVEDTKNRTIPQWG